MSSVNSWNYCVICMSGFLKEAIEFYFIFTVLDLLGERDGGCLILHCSGLMLP